MRKIPAVIAKREHRRITLVCSPVFAHLANSSLFSLQISLLCVECRWQEKRIGHFGVGMHLQNLQSVGIKRHLLLCIYNL